MKVKNIRLAVRSLEDMHNEIKDVFEKAERGEKTNKREGIYFENIEAMRKVLTEERLRILKTVRRDHPSSIYELAKILGRDVKNTHEDVRFLEQAGMLELKKSDAGRGVVTPEVNYEKILLEIAV